MSEDYKDFTKVTPGRGKKTNIVTPRNPTRFPRFQSELTARKSLFQPEEEADWVDIDMGTNNNLIKLETLLPERKPFKQPTTKDVIIFKRELVTALTKFPDPRTDQGYACIIETEEEYQTSTVSKWKQTVTRIRPEVPL